MPSANEGQEEFVKSPARPPLENTRTGAVPKRGLPEKLALPPPAKEQRTQPPVQAPKAFVVPTKPPPPCARVGWVAPQAAVVTQAPVAPLGASTIRIAQAPVPKPARLTPWAGGAGSVLVNPQQAVTFDCEDGSHVVVNVQEQQVAFRALTESQGAEESFLAFHNQQRKPQESSFPRCPPCTLGSSL